MKKILMLASKTSGLTGNRLPYPLLSYSDLAIFLDTQKPKDQKVKVMVKDTDISTYEFVYFRTWRKYEKLVSPIARYLHSFSIPFVDSEIVHTQPDSKTFEYITCALSNLPIPHSIIGHVKKLLKIRKAIESEFSYPVILKAAEGKQGKDNYLVQDFKELESILIEYPMDTTFIVQEFIPNSFDYRFVVTGYKTALVYQRIRDPRSRSHLNNVSQGGMRKNVDITSVKDLCKIAEKVSKLLHREICGVDIVIDSRTQKPYILEANSAPQLSYIPALKVVKDYLEELA